MYINNYENCREIRNEINKQVRKITGIDNNNQETIICQFFPENMEKNYQLFVNAYREASFSDEVCDIKILEDYNSLLVSNSIEGIRSPLLKVNII